MGREPASAPAGDSVAGKPVWNLADVPEFSVSESATPPAFQLFRAWYGVILEDGSVVVANVGSSNLIYFDDAGQAQRVVGREGDGPGEFAGISDLFVADAGVGVWDTRARRVSFFSARGDPLNALSIQGRFVQAVGALSGAGVVATPFVTETRPAVPGEARVYRVWSDSEELWGELAGPLEPHQIYLRYPRPNATGFFTAAFNLWEACVPRMTEVVVGSEIYIGEPGSGTITAIATSGTSREVYRAESRRAITEERLETMRTLIEGRDIPVDSIESVFRQIGGADAPLPAWERIVPDPSGRLWLGLPRCVEGGAESYDVIDTAGALLGTITIPEEMTLLTARDDRALVVRRDELGVEYLELYRILGGPTG